MDKTNKKTENSAKKVVLLVAILGLLLFNSKNAAQGVSCESAAIISCANLSKDDAIKCLNKIADECRNLKEIKSQQQDTLQTQLDLINTEQQRNQIELQVTQKKAETVSQQINDLEQQVAEKEKQIQYQKTILVGLMQTYYDYYQQGILNIVLLNKDLSNFFNQSDYIEQSSTKINDVLGSIRDAKNNLEGEQLDLQQKKAEMDRLKGDLQDRNYYLEANESQKQSLIVKTQGEEAKYKDLLAQVERQKLELFDFSSASNLGEVSASVDSYQAPDKKYSTDWYFSQKDSRWADERIGLSSYLMKNYGCAVAAVSMVFRNYGSSIDPGKLAKQKIFDDALIIWPGSWNPGIILASSTAHSGVSWSTVDSAIKNNHPVIVYIRKTNGKGGHYVVIYAKDSNDYIVNDPYFGPKLYLSTSRALVGKIGADSGTKIDQMIIYKK